MSRVLIVEDQPAVAHALEVLFGLHEIACEVAAAPAEAIKRVASGEISLVVQDMNFSRSETSGAEGIDLFRSVRRLDPEMPVLLMTAWTSLETAVALVREGAADYVAKPWDDEKLLASVRNLMQLRLLQAENLRLRAERSASRAAIAREYDLLGIVYESDAMHRVVSLAVQVAASDVPILITGPNGAGKEKIAEIVQANSRRREKPFIRVNVGALPDELLESELFGAEAGAYTGSRRLRIGRFEAADGGTLFLDEIGNLSPAGQVKMLRVLQNREFERLGSNVSRRVDVRVICATNADLNEAIAAGRFREDLFFRLNVIELAVPALADRRDDILPLARSVLEDLSRSRGGEPLGLAAEAAQSLLADAWPGNVRQLVNRIQRAAVLAPHPTLTSSDLGYESAGRAGSTGTTPADPGEKGAVEEVLRRSGGSVSRAAAELNLSRQAFYRKMEKLGIVLERRPRD